MQFDTSHSLTVVSLFLTLGGLLGSYFYIHLGNWYRDVLTLETKWHASREQVSDEQKQGAYECRYEIERVRMQNVLPTTIAIVVCNIALTVLTVFLIRSQTTAAPEWNYVSVAGITFLVIFFSMTLRFLIQGRCRVCNLDREIGR